MRYQVRQYFLLITLACLLVILVGSAIFIYQISPLRDPAFQPNSANAGSLVPWLRTVRESDWLLGATLLSALLALNLAMLGWHRLQALPNSAPRRPRSIDHLIQFVLWSATGFFLFLGFNIVFFVYLSNQWLVD